ncbi:hypothetical protein LEP1GSC021_2661 [Leptospira noguchii str. 1993005606]|uniref:Uncharacterized protein n=2 Tax=Leptospira noguchii TaxID=28182 RepID=M6Y2Z4_9LEPT|nr:hypothetical protein LEP1GSC035_2339 [Leptospira noguchii str. 2007001578]EMO88045.1 hypothetical protein LEP1GSC024_0404 [Leptospira noguchii str. 2001034031]EPE85233.1 hypothetical protein LEP1GSC021_2661 [Leptospira noguchii str. 1993005606]
MTNPYKIPGQHKVMLVLYKNIRKNFLKVRVPTILEFVHKIRFRVVLT